MLLTVVGLVELMACLLQVNVELLDATVILVLP